MTDVGFALTVEVAALTGPALKVTVTVPALLLRVKVHVLLPVVHPRMGTPFSAANTAPLLEPPGFLLLNYGRATPIVTVLAHVVYGGIVGTFVGAR